MNSFTKINHEEFSKLKVSTYNLFLCYKSLVKEFPTLHIESYFIKITITKKESHLNKIKNIFSVSDITCEIYESFDEWFYIETIYKGIRRWYKCDQIEGVIDCIKDIYSI